MSSFKFLIIAPLLALPGCDAPLDILTEPAIVELEPTTAFLEDRISQVFPACLEFAETRGAPKEAALVAMGFTRQDASGVRTYRQAFDAVQEAGPGNEVAVVFNERFGVCGINLPGEASDLAGFAEWVTVKMTAAGYAAAMAESPGAQTFIKDDAVIGVEGVASRGIITVTMYPTTQA